MARGKGRNISNRNLFAICRYLDKWTPQNETEKRDKEILTLAYEFNMTCGDIAKLKKFRGIGNRSGGKLMSDASISRIIAGYNLVWEKRIDYTQRNHYEERKDLQNRRLQGEFDDIMTECEECGSKKNLQLHHIKPLNRGGDNSRENLQCLCKKCHMAKHQYALAE